MLLTPQIAKDFNKCGVSPERISAIVNHGELDKEHTADDFLLIDQVIAPQTSEKDFIETLEKAADITFDFFTELSEQTTH